MNKTKKWLRPTTIVIATFILLAGCGDKSNSNQTTDSRSNMNEHMDMDSMHENSHDNGDGAMKNMKSSSESEHIMVNVPTMQCQICKENIENAVSSLEGIESVDVDKKEKVAHINYVKSKTDLNKIESAITGAGYDANDRKADPEAYSKLDDCCKLPQDRKKK